MHWCVEFVPCRWGSVDSYSCAFVHYVLLFRFFSVIPCIASRNKFLNTSPCQLHISPRLPPSSPSLPIHSNSCPSPTIPQTLSASLPNQIHASPCLISCLPVGQPTKPPTAAGTMPTHPPASPSGLLHLPILLTLLPLLITISNTLKLPIIKTPLPPIPPLPPINTRVTCSTALPILATSLTTPSN